MTVDLELELSRHEVDDRLSRSAIRVLLQDAQRELAEDIAVFGHIDNPRVHQLLAADRARVVSLRAQLAEVPGCQISFEQVTKHHGDTCDICGMAAFTHRSENDNDPA